MELARTVDPASVIALEEEWGDWLSGQQQMDAAINHYIEAGCTIKAIEAAIEDRQCVKAAGLVEFLKPAEAAPYYRRIAQLYEEANNRCADTPRLPVQLRALIIGVCGCEAQGNLLRLACSTAVRRVWRARPLRACQSAPIADGDCAWLLCVQGGG